VDLLHLHRSYNDPLLKESVNKLEMNEGQINNLSKQVHAIEYAFEYEISIKD